MFWLRILSDWMSKRESGVDDVKLRTILTRIARSLSPAFASMLRGLWPRFRSLTALAACYGKCLSQKKNTTGSRGVLTESFLSPAN